MFNRTTLMILLAALGVGLGLLLATQRLLQPAGAPMPALQAVTLYPQPRALPAFALDSADGGTLDARQLAGHWTLVFIGFTACPDVCPITLAELAKAQRRWQELPQASRPQVLFVSVDPERDTPERLGRYAHAFSPDTLVATADVPTLEAFTRSLSLVFAKVATGTGAEHYTIDHSAAIVVLDPQVRMAGVIPGSALDAAVVAADLIALTEASLSQTSGAGAP